MRMNFLFCWEVISSMKNKCTVIQIEGLKGLLILGFVVMCAIAGFIIFPAWCCQHAWNFIAGFVLNMPLMELKHGALLWLIIALILYVTMFSKYKIAFISSNGMPPNYRQPRTILNEEEIVNAIEKKILEKHSQLKAKEEAECAVNSEIDDIKED